MFNEFFNIRGRFEKWRIGSRNAADAPMPVSTIQPVDQKMPGLEARGINIPNDVLKSLELNKGCSSIIGTWSTKK